MSDKFHGGAKTGATSIRIPVVLYKTSDNTKQTGVAAANVTASYWRDGAAPVLITVATVASATAVFSAGGWFENTTAPNQGDYLFHVPDAAWASGTEWVKITVAAPNCFPYEVQIPLESAGSSEIMARIGVNGAGLTALGDTRLAFLDAAISTVGSLAAGAILVNPLNKVLTNASNQVTVGALSATAVQGIWEVPTSTNFAAGTLGLKFKNWTLGSDNKALLSTDAQTGVTIPNVTTTGTVSGAVGSVSGNVVGTVGGVAGNVSGSVGSVLGAVNSVTQPVTLTTAEKENIAVRVEAHLLDETDGQKILNAIVGAIGNQNIDQLALVAAVQAAIERAGGPLALIANDYARRTGDYATAQSIANVANQITALPAPDNVSIGQIKTQTDKIGTAAVASKADVTVTVNPTLTPDQSTKLDTAAAAATKLNPLIVGNSFTATALENAPAGGDGGGGGATPKQIWEYQDRSLTEPVDTNPNEVEEGIKAKTDLIRDSVATTGDVQPTIAFSPTINPTLTQEQGEMLVAAASAAAKLYPLIVNGAFTAFALKNAPVGTGDGGGGTGPIDLTSIFHAPVAGGVTFIQILRLLAAVHGGKTRRTNTGDYVFRDIEDTVDVVRATIDGNGDRDTYLSLVLASDPQPEPEPELV